MLTMLVLNIQSVYTAVTGIGFLATGKPSLRIYIKVPYSVPFALDLFHCGFRLRVSSMVTVSVSFIFFCIFKNLPCRLNTENCHQVD